MADYMSDEERHEIGYKLFSAHVANGGKVAAVSYKDEGRYGPVYAYAEGVDYPGKPGSTPSISFGRPYGSPDPEGTFYLGWNTRAKARALSKQLGATFQEW